MPILSRGMLGLSLCFLALAGGFCPKSATDAGDITESGLLIYISRTSASSALYVGNIEGSILTQVGLGMSPAIAPTDGATLSPERGRVAFAMADEVDGLNDIFVMNRDGTALINLTQSADVDECDPDWCRSGDYIAYAAGGDVWTLSPEGGSPVNRTHTESREEADPSASPDGLEIAFTVDPNADNSDVEVVTLATGETRSLAGESDVDEYDPSWSPTGTRVAYAGRPLEVGVSEEVDLYLRNSDGTSRRNITNAGGDLLCRCPAWSPKEDRLAFRGTQSGATHSDVYTVQPNGSGLLRFQSTSTTSETHVDWR